VNHEAIVSEHFQGPAPPTWQVNNTLENVSLNDDVFISLFVHRWWRCRESTPIGDATVKVSSFASGKPVIISLTLEGNYAGKLTVNYTYEPEG